MLLRMPAMLGLLVVLSLGHSAWAQRPDDVLNKLPDWANALVVVDYRGILASPLAQKEGWEKLPAADTLGTSLPYLKNTHTAWLAAHLEPGTLRSQNDLVIIRGGPFPAVKELVKLENGMEEQIGSVPAILTARNAYILALSDSEVAVNSPANRQNSARWLQFSRNNQSPVIADYLQQAAASLKDGYHIIISIDLHDAIDPHLVRRFLAQSTLLKDKKVNIDALVRVLTSSRGIRIGVRFDQTIKATLAGDFSENISEVSKVLPGLVLSALEEMGGELEEFPAASAAIENKSFLITSTLSTQALRKVMRLVTPFSGAVLAPRDVPIKGPDQLVQNSQKYFKQMRDLANEANSIAERRNDMILAAQRYDKAARLIDQLPVGGVDEELVAFSNTMSSRLRAIADALRSAILEANAVEGGKRKNVQVIPGTYMGFTLGPWNPDNPGDPFSPGGLWYRPMFTPPTVNVQTNYPEIYARQLEVLAVGAKKRLELWRQLSDETANMRKKLSIKHNVDF
ncbi:MAG: hypothetical protein JNJ77_14220 [Planctomycetia bacterium]|nr:hypothetical protein [Planctomycetia bacterium]